MDEKLLSAISKYNVVDTGCRDYCIERKCKNFWETEHTTTLNNCFMTLVDDKLISHYMNSLYMSDQRQDTRVFTCTDNTKFESGGSAAVIGIIVGALAFAGLLGFCCYKKK